MFSSWKTSPFLCLGIFLWITLHVQCRPSSSSTDHDPGTTDITKCGPNDTVPPNRVNTSVQLNLVRQEMTRVNITVLIIPLDSVGRLKWVSGFSGSNGEAVITYDQGKYEHESDCRIIIVMSHKGNFSRSSFLLT